MKPLLTPSRKRHASAALLAVAAHILVLAAGEGLWQLASHERQPQTAARQSSSLLVSLSLAPEAASAERAPAKPETRAPRPASATAALAAATVAKAELAEPEAALLTEAQSTAESPVAPLATATNTELQAATSSAPVAANSTQADSDTESSDSTAATQRELLSWLHSEIAHSLVYPAIARRRGLEGRVELSLAISADGSLLLAQLRSSSGHRILDVAALDFLRDLFPSPLAPGADIQLPVNVEWRLED